MRETNRKVKSVSFNLNDPMELEMYEHSMKFSNFSTYVKRLIQNSLNSISIKHQDKPVQKVNNPPMEQVLINPEHLKQLI